MATLTFRTIEKSFKKWINFCKKNLITLICISFTMFNFVMISKTFHKKYKYTKFYYNAQKNMHGKLKSFWNRFIILFNALYNDLNLYNKFNNFSVGRTKYRKNNSELQSFFALISKNLKIMRQITFVVLHANAKWPLFKFSCLFWIYYF